MTISANALAVKNENKKIKEAKEAENLAVKTETVKKSLSKGMDIQIVADITDTSVDFVKSVQRQLSAN